MESNQIKRNFKKKIAAFLMVLLIMVGALPSHALGNLNEEKKLDYNFQYERKHLRDKDIEELSRQLACFWVSREVSFVDYDSMGERLVTKMNGKELAKLNQKFIYGNGKAGENFNQGYKIQFKKKITAGTIPRDYLASGTLCIAYRQTEENQNTFLIAIRGSLGDTDWMTNLNLEPGLSAGFPGIAQRLRDVNESLNTMNKDYHIGFFKSVDLMMPELLKLTFERHDGESKTLGEIVKDKNEKNGFLICGYSKGAALSQILTMKLATTVLYRKKGDEKRNGICSYNFAGPNVYNGENKKSVAGKDRKKAELLCKEVSLFNFNIDGDAINLAEQIYKRKYGESYLIESTLPYGMKTLRMVEIHEEWYRALFEHIKNGELGKYNPIG